MKNVSKKLSLFSVIMITIGSVDSVRNLPAAALIGTSLIFFFILGAFLFLLPSALVSAELSSMWRKKGGVYVWVKEAFGQKFAFFAIWLQWVQHIIWYPTLLSFIAGTLGFAISPSLAGNKYFLAIFILTLFWATTFINLYGIKYSAKIANFCSISGLLIPMTMLMIFSVHEIWSGHSLQMHFDWKDIIPSHFESDMWVALIGIILSFCGIEVATVHVRAVENPQSVFPKALLYSTLIILITLIFGSLAITLIVPHGKISLVSGMMQAFKAFFGLYHVTWLLPVAAILLSLGSLGSLNNWIIAPARGLVIAGNDGNLPPLLCQENKHKAPAFLLLTQAVIVTGLASIFVFMPSVNGSYWLLTVLASQLYMLMYVLMFAAAIYLRFSQPDIRRTFQVAGGKIGMCVVGGFGLLSSLGVFLAGFVYPKDIDIGGIWYYEIELMIGLFLLSAFAFVVSSKFFRTWVAPK